MITKLLIVLLITTIYTIIRYVVFGNVDLIHLPIYLLNKSVSMAATIYILFASISYAKGRFKEVKYWGRISWYSVILHILFSFSILSSSYYPKFFGAEKMNLIGELTILFGAVATLTFWFLYTGKKTFKNVQLLQVLTGLLVAAHLVIMGFEGWLDVSKWYGGLPPISLLSFIAIFLSFLFFIWTKISSKK